MKCNMLKYKLLDLPNGPHQHFEKNFVDDIEEIDDGVFLRTKCSQDTSEYKAEKYDP